MKNKYRIGLLFSFLMIIGCNDVGRYQIFYDKELMKSVPRALLIDTKTGDLYVQKKKLVGRRASYLEIRKDKIDVNKWVLIETLDDKLVKEKPKEISE